jgi:hypothetical protein
VFASRTWARIGLALNVLGAICLFYAFQATSSEFRLITKADGEAAICVQGHTVMMRHSNGGWSLGSERCPSWMDGKPAAVVNIEHPSLITIGFIATFFGFAIQFFTIPSDPTADQIARELRILRKLRKQLEKPLRK